MENKTENISSDKLSVPDGYIDDNRFLRSKIIQLTLVAFTSILVIGIIVFLLYLNTSRNRSDLENNNQTIPTNTSLVAPTSLPSVTSCKEIEGLKRFEICSIPDVPGYMSLYMKVPSGVIDHVIKYSLSPNKEWMLVVSYSDDFIRNVGAPAENALYMIDITNSKVITLFSQVMFPNFNDQSWSPKNNGIVLTASGAATPNIFGDSYNLSVIYCTVSCKVVANNAGPDGIGGDPAYFTNGMIHYTSNRDEPVEINFN